VSARTGQTAGERRGSRMRLPRSEWGSGGPSLTRPPSKKTPRILGTLVELLLAASLFAALGVFHVWSRTRVLASGYALAELQEEHARLVAAQDQLRIELGMLTSFQALDQAARTKLSSLGLAPPDRGAVWAASPGRPPTDSPGRAGVDGVGHRPGPAGPIVGRGDDGRSTAYGPRLSGRMAGRNSCGPKTDGCRLRTDDRPLAVAARGQ
jgi:hypothetical protein